MEPAARRISIVVALGVIVVAVVAWKTVQAMQPRAFELATATVTKLDVEKRTAEIEFVHPKSGRTMKATGSVPRDCSITIDGEPATLADIRVGDVGSLGAIGRGYSVEADWVRIRRQQATSQPAAGPSTSNGL